MLFRSAQQLQKSIRSSGHRCTRVAVNGGDLMGTFRGRTIAYFKSYADWPSWIAEFARKEGVTDLICYGDCRPYHRVAIQTLKPLGIRIFVLEEGYLRPNWITCEMNGVNGHSVLTDLDLDRVPALARPPEEEKLPGSNLRYCLAGIAYYFWTFLLTPMFPRYERHRELDVIGEATLWLQRLSTWPLRRNRTERALKAIERLDKPLHLVLLQLNGDSQIKVHSSFESTRAFVEFCIAEFAASGAHDALLVFKNHPLDSGVIDLHRCISEEARRHSLADRVFFVETGKLVPLLERSISATAINSTACHQALLRGIPTLVLGKAVFNHPQIVSRMRLADLFRLRPYKNASDYTKLIALMRQTCQFNGSFYSEEGRRILMPILTRALIGGLPDARAFETRSEAEVVKQAS